MPHSGRVRWSGWLGLAACIAALIVVWGVLLPRLAERPKLAERIEWLDERGIDPSAMYYTELEAMKPILEKLNIRERRPVPPPEQRQ